MILFLLFGTACAQETPPLDTLYAGDTISFGLKLILKPIQWWQHLSYHSQVLNCQFERSCSNFMVEAILDKGLISGAIIGTDRIVRCNQAARHYHLKIPGARIQYDGRLIEPLDWTAATHAGKNVPLAVIISAIPGLGRAYAGHPVDGLYSFLLVAVFANNAYRHDQNDNSFGTILNTGLMSLFWAADIYGAYRTAKMTPPKK